MIKKSLGIALLVTSVLVMGCSSDDDGETTPATTDGATDDAATDDGATDDAATDDGATDDGATDDGATDDGGTDGGELTRDPGSTTDVVYRNGEANLALEALLDEGLALSMNSESWTYFLPDDASVQAALDAGATLDNAVFQKHIVTTETNSSTELVAQSGGTITVNDGTVYDITGGSPNDPLRIGGVEVGTADLQGSAGATVHIIKGILP